MTGSYISRAMSSPACSARIPRLPVRYAVILCLESIVNFRCIKAEVAMQQDIPSLQHAVYYFTKPLSAKQARSLDVETIDTPWHNRLHWTSSNDWHSATQKKAQVSAVEFPVLLPGLLVGITPSPGHIEVFSRDDGLESHTESATVYLTAASLIAHFKNTLAARYSAKLTLTYMAIQGLNSETRNHSTS